MISTALWTKIRLHGQEASLSHSQHTKSDGWPETKSCNSFISHPPQDVVAEWRLLARSLTRGAVRQSYLPLQAADHDNVPLALV